MNDVRLPRVEINGQTATVEQIWGLDLSDSGHFTAMQVRGRQTLGMEFHLARLDAATRELFGLGLDGGRVRGYIRHALAQDTADASVRVNVFRSGAADDVSVMISVRPPASAPADPQSLQTVDYQRPVAHIKHAGGFGQSYYGGLARGNGFDEALFVGPGGAISEGSITNIGFIEGDAIVWPEAPALRGVMMQVLQRELERKCLPSRYEAVHVADLASFEARSSRTPTGWLRSRASTTEACQRTLHSCALQSSFWQPPPSIRSEPAVSSRPWTRRGPCEPARGATSQTEMTTFPRACPSSR